MISKLIIRNFQSLASVDLPIARVTAFTGDSDVGKSAIVRALWVLALNRSSEAFFHKGNGPLLIEVHTTAGDVVQYSRPKGKSAVYVLNGVTYDKIGREVPEEVSKALGLRQYLVDHDVSVFPSVQRQLDPQFLLQAPDSVVSKTIGHISNINIIFAALRKAAADALDLQTQQTALRAQLELNTKETESLADLDTRLALAAALRALEAKLDQQLARRDLARTLAEQLRDTKRRLDEAEQHHDLHEKLASQLTVLSRRADHATAATALASRLALQGRALRLETEKTDAVQAILARTLTAETLASQLALALRLRNRLEDLRGRHNALKREVETEVAALTREEEALAKELHALPLCPLIRAEFKTGCRDLIAVGSLRAKP